MFWCVKSFVQDNPSDPRLVGRKCVRACLHKSPSRVRFRANRASSRHRRMTESDPEPSSRPARCRPVAPPASVLLCCRLSVIIMLEHLNPTPQKPNRVVVLGAYGFVGGTCARLLAARGVPVLPLDKD